MTLQNGWPHGDANWHLHCKSFWCNPAEAG